MIEIIEDEDSISVRQPCREPGCDRMVTTVVAIELADLVRKIAKNGKQNHVWWTCSSHWKRSTPCPLTPRPYA